MPANIPRGRIDRVVVSLDGAGDGFAEPHGTKGCARIQCREPPSTCSQEDELVKKLKSACRGDLRTPVLFVASLLRSGERPKKAEESCVGGDSLPGGKYKRFRSVLKSLKCLLKKLSARSFPMSTFHLTCRLHVLVGHGPNCMRSYRVAR